MKNLILYFAVLSLLGCTENMLAKNYGGEMTYDPPCGQKIVNVTWKDDDLWVLTWPLGDHWYHEVPEVWSFTADSSFGVFEGTVTLTERVCS